MVVLYGVTDVSEFAILVISDEEIADLSQRLIMPYVGMAIIFVILIFMVYFAKLPILESRIEQAGEVDGKESILDFPHTILGVIAIFCYLGVEVIAGDTINLYGSKIYVDNFSVLTAYTMSFMVIGYLLGMAAIPKYISQAQALLLSAIVGAFCIFGIVYSSIDENGISGFV